MTEHITQLQQSIQHNDGILKPKDLKPKDLICITTTNQNQKLFESKPKCNLTGIMWYSTIGWLGITNENKLEWQNAYPNCAIETTLAKMHLWLKANPTKAHRKNWLRFITNWFARTRENGGNMPGQRPTESNF